VSTVSRSIIDPSRPGTEDSAWQRALAKVPDWTPPDGPLLIVSPHPDDEVLGAGGLIHTWKILGRSVTVVSLTDGEAAYPQYRRLGQIRREELKEALQVLSEHPVLVVRLGIPDGRVADYGSKLRSAVFSLLDPDTTVLVPYEQDGHPDHDAVYRVGTGTWVHTCALSHLGMAPRRSAGHGSCAVGKIQLIRHRASGKVQRAAVLFIAIISL
jgi:LmbE family N-acetylglucosaminyl deacetylase